MSYGIFDAFLSDKTYPDFVNGNGTESYRRESDDLDLSFRSCGIDGVVDQ
jgi:hypothetical protein